MEASRRVVRAGRAAVGAERSPSARDRHAVVKQVDRALGGWVPVGDALVHLHDAAAHPRGSQWPDARSELTTITGGHRMTSGTPASILRQSRRSRCSSSASCYTGGERLKKERKAECACASPPAAWQ